MSKTQQFSRRAFFKYSAVIGAQAAFHSSSIARAATLGDLSDAVARPVDLVVANGSSPAQNCLAAVETLGGFSRFVSPGDRVVVKPNPIGSNPPEQATNTHPDMVETVIKECFRFGAKEVLVVSHDSERSFVGNGIGAAIERAGGVMKALEEESMYREVAVPRGRILRHEKISIDILESDVFINMPIAKHHAGAEVTLSMKNLMGINWDRIRFHQTDLHQCIAELAATVRPHLTILDANNVLLTNGPGGPGEVLPAQKVIAGVDPVAIDSFVTKAFWGEPETIRHIQIAYDLGVGEIDLSKLNIKEFDV